jgi:hypothetical protein
LDAEDVVVGREHVHGGRVGGTHGDSDLGVVDAGEVAGTSWLVLLGLERERVRVHTRRGVTGVVVEGLDLVEVLTLLLLEAILAVKHKLEGGQGTGVLLSVLLAGDTSGVQRGTNRGDGHEAVGEIVGVVRVGLENNLGTHSVLRGEVPQLGTRGGVGEAPHELLDGVVVGEADLLGLTGGDGVGTGVLDLLDQVLMTLLGEATTLLGVEVHVVGPHLEDGGVKVGGEGGREVDVDAHLVVLEGDEGQVETGVAVEEEDEGKVDGAGGSSGHLGPVSLLGLVEVKLGVQAPPLLVVLVDTLATDGQLDVVDRTLGDPVAVVGSVGSRGVGREREELEVHVTNEITVAGDGDGDATGVGGSTVDGLLDVLHREVGVALVLRLVEGDFGVASQVYILGTVSYELHETAGHCECFVLYTEKIILGKRAFPDPKKYQSKLNVDTA